MQEFVHPRVLIQIINSSPELSFEVNVKHIQRINKFFLGETAMKHLANSNYCVVPNLLITINIVEYIAVKVNVVIFLNNTEAYSVSSGNKTYQKEDHHQKLAKVYHVKKIPRIAWKSKVLLCIVNYTVYAHFEMVVRHNYKSEE
jgi:hypothetical protein